MNLFTGGGIPANAIGRGADACTIGDNQYYNNIPRPDQLGELPWIGHESVHSLQKHMIGNSTIGMLIGYVYDCWTSGLEEGDFYKKSLSELQAYAVESTIRHLLDNDPIFRDAVKNGTTGQLPDAYRRKMALLFSGFYNEGLQAAPRPQTEVDDSWYPGKYGGY